MIHSIFQIDRQEDTHDDEEDNWWELWDRRRRMAVAQVLCYVVYAIYIRRAYYEEERNDFEILSKKDRKRRAREWEMELEGIKEAVNNVTEAIREGNAILEVAQQRTYSEREVYAELVKIGVERHLRYNAYTLLTQDPVRVRAFFGYPVNERKDFLLQMMYAPVDL